MTVSPREELQWYLNLPWEKWLRYIRRKSHTQELRRLQIMALTDYSDLEKEIEDAPELTILPRGKEVKARIISVNSGISDKNDATWYMPTFDVPAVPLCKEFKDFFWDLADRDKLDDKAAARALSKFKNFAKCFDIDYSRPFDWEDDLEGKEGDVILGVKKDDEYGDQNTISKYVVGK